MADAGKVAILPRGLWNADTVYEPLDLVYYDNNSFVSLKESVGVTPVDGDTWMLSLSGISQETIDAILNGTQQVGDSARLGGKGASEYALIDGFETIFLSSETTEEVDQILNNLHETEANRGFYVRSIGFGTTHPKLGGATGLIIGFRSNQKYGWQLFVSYDDAKQMLFRQIYNSVWTDWDSNAFASDLANYLPLSGGKLTKSNTPLILESTGEGVGSFLAFKNTHVAGHDYIGWRNHKFCVQVNGGEDKEVLHTGNKPSGSYTGNGDATERTINVGGIGKVLFVRSSNGYETYVSEFGAFYLNAGVNLQVIKYTEYSFVNGVLKIATTNEAVNHAGSTHDYWLL